MKKKDCEYGCVRGYCLIYGVDDDSKCKHYKESNESDDYYNQKSESRSKILKPITHLVAIFISIALWTWIFNCITKAL